MNNNSIGDEALEEAQKQTKSGIACDGIRQQVKQCLLESDCIKVWIIFLIKIGEE